MTGAMSINLRFFPKVKKNYDYAVVIFLLTFNLITISSYRVEDVLKLACECLYTMAIGSKVCVLMSLFVFPIWSGEDLHNFSVSKIEGVAKSIEACVNEYFSKGEPGVVNGTSMEDPIYKNYKAVLDSKSTDETLALHASWEPRHSWHCNPFPWQQYVKLGVVLRHFGYIIVALHGTLQTEFQVYNGKTRYDYEKAYKDYRNRTVAVRNFRGELVTSFEDHLLWHPDCNTNNIYITIDQDLIISYCKADSDETGVTGNGSNEV